VRALRDDFEAVPLPRRYSPKHRGYEVGMARHAAAVAAGVPAYRDPTTGNAVFTARFLADRDYCCESGCRHCPYVPVGR
jgi:hypothetical protein